MMGSWIPCSERLPEKSGEYLVVYSSTGQISVGSHQ